jgi:hypothetical protein
MHCTVLIGAEWKKFTLEALASLREQGKIRHVALSNVTREHVERARRIVPIVSVQNRYSFADRESDFIVDYCEQNYIGFLRGLRSVKRKRHMKPSRKSQTISIQPVSRSPWRGCSSVPK